MESKVITKIEELDSLENDWNKLIENIDSTEIFYSWEWMKLIVRCMYGNELNLFIVVIRDKDCVVSIAPMCIEELVIGIRKCKIMHSIVNRTSDYSAFYLHKDYNNHLLLKKIFDEIYKNSDKWDYIELRNFNTRDKNTFLIGEIIKSEFKGKCFSEQSVITPYLLNSEISVKANKNQLKDIERRERKILKEHKLEVLINQKFDKCVWNEFINLHKRRWKQGIFYKKDYLDFYESIIPKLERKDMLEFSYLKIDEKIAAVHFGFKDNNKVYYYIPIYSDEYSSLGVGYILLKHIIEKYRNDKVEFDFLRGNEKYKFDWTDLTHMNYNFYIINKNGKYKYLNIYTKLMLYGKSNNIVKKIMNK